MSKEQIGAGRVIHVAAISRLFLYLYSVSREHKIFSICALALTSSKGLHCSMRGLGILFVIESCSYQSQPCQHRTVGENHGPCIARANYGLRSTAKSVHFYGLRTSEYVVGAYYGLCRMILPKLIHSDVNCTNHDPYLDAARRSDISRIAQGRADY